MGTSLIAGGRSREIKEVITIDGRKMIFTDDSWLLIRPSGTEPKMRFYVETRTEADKDVLLTAATEMLRKIGLVG